MKQKNIIGGLAGLALLFITQLASAQVSAVEDDIIKIPGITTESQIFGLSPAQKQISISYYDGLGRPIQSVAVQASPMQKSIVQPAVYNNLGQQPTSYLAYTATDSTGQFRTNALSAQSAFYRDTTQYLIATDTMAFATQVFETSPFQRVLRSGMVGAGFQPGGSTQHFKTIRYRPNRSGDGNILIWNPNGTYTTGTYYAVQSLWVTDALDEDNTETLAFADFAGRTILKRQKLGSTNLDTYYIYNNAGMISYIVPPLATAALAANSYNLGAAPLSNMVFKYMYDGRGRVIQQKVPAKAVMSIIYDPLNRPVLMQDANLAANNQWKYVKYDVEGRVISNGIYTDASYTGQSAMQTYVNTLSSAYNSVWYESRSTTAANGYYTLNVFPSAGIRALSYAYFDNYDLNHNGTPDYSYHSQGLTFTSPHGVAITEDSATTAPLKGVPTMVRTATLGFGSVKWLLRVTFYDKYGNPIQTQSNNHLLFTTDTITDYATNVPDFTGKPLVTQLTKKTGSGTLNTNTIQTVFTYDSGNSRLQFVDQKYNSQANIRIANYTYNELGQPIIKKLGYNGSNYMQWVNMRYNIRGQLTTINNSTLTNDGGKTNANTNVVFGMQLLYNVADSDLGNTPYYNGKLSAVKWMSKNAAGQNSSERSYKYSYDAINRDTAANYAERLTAGTGVFNQNTGGFDEAGITYDYNGNINHLNRNSSTQGTNTHTVIDNLSYTYSTNNPNRLLSITDAGTSAGFNNITGSTTNYGYDNNGNLTADRYKGITIAYNVLNKTDKINLITGPGGTAITGDSLRYTYDGGGNVIEKQLYTTGTLTATTDYVDGFTYTNGALSYLPMPEGRIADSSGTLSPEYIISDQQGNARVSFKDNGSGSAKVIQEDSYYAFGLVMLNSPVTSPAVPNKKLYNGGSEWQDEYNNTLNYYQTFNRNYDPAIGRFMGVDPVPESAESITTYNYAGNNPIMYNDPLGDITPYGYTDAQWYGMQHPFSGHHHWGPIDETMQETMNAVAKDVYDHSNSQTNNYYTSFWSAVSNGVMGLPDGTYTVTAKAVSESYHNYLYDDPETRYNLISPYFGKYLRFNAEGKLVHVYGEYDKDKGLITTQDYNTSPTDGPGGTLLSLLAANQGGSSNTTSGEGFDYEKLGSAIVTGTDSYGVALTKANVINTVLTGSKIEGKAFKYLTGSGTVVGAVAGGIPAAISIYNNGLNWRNGTAAGLAVLGVVSEFTGLGEAWDGTVGLGIAVGSLGFDIWDATHPAK